MARASARALRVPKNPKPAKPLLPRRQKECAELMRAGLSTREIAARMGLSPLTIATYSKRIYAALKLKGRAELQALPMSDGELDKLRAELAAVRADRDRIRSMYDGLDGARESIVVRNVELEAGLTTLQTGIREILAMPEDDDREKFDKIFAHLPSDGLDTRAAFVEAMKGARMVGLSTSQKLAEQLALLTSPCAARELAEAKEDAARVNRLYGVAIDALCRTRADLVALQNELLKLAADWESSAPGGAGWVSQQTLRALAEGSQARARHDGAGPQAKPLGLLEQAAAEQEVVDRQNDVTREVVRLRSAWNLLDTTVSTILTSRTATWNTDELRAALGRARALAEGKPSP